MKDKRVGKELRRPKDTHHSDNHLLLCKQLCSIVFSFYFFLDFFDFLPSMQFLALTINGQEIKDKKIEPDSCYEANPRQKVVDLLVTATLLNNLW
jgi:hypothetical protein